MALTQDILKSLLDYDPTTGEFKWFENHGHKRVGNVTPQGYIRITIREKRYLAHRLAWLFCHGHWPAKYIDHIDGDKANNRIENLREATRAENQRNMKLRSDNKLGLKGVLIRKGRKKFYSVIQLKGKQVCLGRFDTAQEAHSAYWAAAQANFGEFARAM